MTDWLTCPRLVAKTEIREIRKKAKQGSWLVVPGSYWAKQLVPFWRPHRAALGRLELAASPGQTHAPSPSARGVPVAP